MEEVLDERELAFLAELRKYENKWVAIYESSDEEIIVGSGEDATDAKREAEGKGFKNVVLFRVTSFQKRYVPLARG